MGNLAIEQVAENQASPEVTINDGTAALDEAITELLDVSLASGNGNISVLQLQRHMLFTLSGVATSGRTVTLTPTVPLRSLFLVECPAANTDTVALICGATTVVLSPGRLYAVRTDGTADGLVARDVGGTSEPSDFSIFLPGLMVNAQLLYRKKVQRAFKLPTNLAGSNLTGGTAATGSTTITFKRNGSSIGTAVWSASGTVAAATVTATAFAVGDSFEIDGPATADATLADVALDLLGSR